MEAWPIKALKAAPISRKLEIAQNAKSCSKQKKFLEIRKVAQKLPCNLWQALNQPVSNPEPVFPNIHLTPLHFQVDPPNLHKI